MYGNSNLGRKKNSFIRPETILARLARLRCIKETRSVTMNIFRKKSILFKSFVKIELSYVFTINMLSTAENCSEK